VGCRKRVEKKEVVTFRNKDGVLVLDEKGDMPGRGMNLCKNVECYDLAVKKGLFKKIGSVKDVPEKLREQFIGLIGS